MVISLPVTKIISYVRNPWQETLTVQHNNQGSPLLRMSACFMMGSVLYIQPVLTLRSMGMLSSRLEKDQQSQISLKKGSRDMPGVAVIVLVTKLCMKERQSRRVKKEEEWQGEMDSYSHSRLPNAGTANSHVSLTIQKVLSTIRNNMRVKSPQHTLRKDHTFSWM